MFVRKNSDHWLHCEATLWSVLQVASSSCRQGCCTSLSQSAKLSYLSERVDKEYISFPESTL